MKRSLLALAPALLLAACGPKPEGEAVTTLEFGEDGTKIVRNDGDNGTQVAADVSPATSTASACEKVTFEEVALTHCIADPARHRITTVLGDPYRGFSQLAKARSGADPAFAMNGGMFDAAGKPIGYYVERSERLKELSTADGPGNFHLKPNGVFYGSDGEWRIRATPSFLGNVSDRPKFGTQSGPMLLIDGKLHPEFSQDGPSRQIRNGVGVDSKGRAHFVIADAPISFGKFARFFRDVANTPNALFLDGNVSSLWDPASGRMDTHAPLGPLIVVENK
ncbi:phosphodiester glycosidase family protein [Qipengyuania sp. CAU 1752]